MQGMSVFHNYHCGWVTAIMWFKNIMLILLSPPQDMIILGILKVRTKNSEQLT